MPSPFKKFNRKYHALFRSDFCPLRDNIRATLDDAVDIATRPGKFTDALSSHSLGEQMLIHTVAAGVALHLSGVFAEKLGISDADHDLPDATIDRLMRLYSAAHRDRHLGEAMARSLGLKKNEIEAVWSYTQANKEVEDLGGGKVNPSYMKKAFGSFDSGWKALSVALAKLPSFGRLGMRVPTFRTVRNADETGMLQKLPRGSRLVLGFAPMKGGQRHVTSTAVTMSKWTLPSAVKESGGVLCYVGTSAVFINWLGQYGLGMDGGESLYPPGTIMEVVAELNNLGYAHKDGNLPIFLLREITAFAESDLSAAAYYDDHTFAPIKDASLITAARKSSQDTRWIDFERFHDGALAEAFYEV